MRRLFTPVAITTAALIAAGALGSASADETTPVPAPAAAAAPRLLSVTGAAGATVRSDNSKAVFTQTYRAQLSIALDDAAAKATAIAAKEGVSLGTIQSISEDSQSALGDCEGDYGYAVGDAAAGIARPTPGPAIKKKKTTKRHHTATKKKHATRGYAAVASAASAPADSQDDVYPCSVEAHVTVAYAIS